MIGEPMSGRGRLQFELPRLDIPINQLFVTINVPQNFRYSEWEGDMKELENRQFASVPPTSSTAQNRQYSIASNMPRSQVLRSNSVSNLDVTERVEGTMKSYGFTKAGVLPVQIDVPVSGGADFRFQQLLVSNANASISLRLQVNFKQVSKGCCQRRRVSACTIC